mmetsp:Transcript_492/g.840  ORF Transcript_492/g.840 Transcript_492/m.840 type:complete len:291 (-) Transcript_492:145-1017(-)|eukprot:CAMPEP_0196809362 /NCGR_PEP_ID=MMETSP1362-20130617/9310_1 /TAXON_ID=163516 /ORGANISM="Leptocylindrus danicus, Strain CCMP1856" /LENGTH=290 /DNA_ID=CAMNT_0042184035 /DNA_START=190 /DNA_END=1059 /DNA_ORIENTATION=+
MVRTRRSARVKTAKDALRSKNLGVVANIDVGKVQNAEASGDSGGGDTGVPAKRNNKKIIFDADYDAADDDGGDTGRDDSKEDEPALNSDSDDNDDDDDDDDAPAEEVSGSSSRKLIMNQRAEERLASKTSTYSSSSKRKRRNRKEDDDDDGDDGDSDDDDDDDDEEEEELFRRIDEERRSQAKEAKKMRRAKPFENNKYKPSGKHISFPSEMGLLDEEMKSKKLSEHNLEIVVSKKLHKDQARALLGNKKPSAAALLFAQRSGTIVDEEQPQWRRTKSRKFYKVIGQSGW